MLILTPILLSAHSIILMRYSIIILALLITGCASYTPNLPSIRPYKLDIQQGNVVTPKMMLQLRPGMTKAQVSFIMGTPLLTDSFHADRWDYFYQMSRDGKVLDQRRIILEFEGDALSHIHGDVIPTGKGDNSLTVKPINEPKADLEIDGKPKRDQKGLLDRLKFWGDDEKAKPAAEPKVEVQPEASPGADQVAAPVPVTPPANAQEEKPLVKPAPEKKGWLDKLKFWENNDEKPPVVPVPVPAPTAEPAVAPVSAPPPSTEVAPESAPAPEAKPEVTPEAAPVSVPKPEAAPAPAPEAAPQTAPAPAPLPEAAPEPMTAPVAKPEVAPQPKAEIKPVKPAPAPDKVAPTPKDLPPEDAPDYFERMLEKIGF